MQSPPTIAWDDRGLIPAVAQDRTTGAVLMLAWMNQEAFERTRDTGLAHFYSRSRQALWKKGETSGNTLAVAEMRLDCDGDSLLLAVDPAGPACHTGTRSCFHRPVGDGAELDNGPAGAPAAIIDRLYRVLCSRRDDSDARTSYTASLLQGGMARIADKIAEEHGELAAELDGGADGAVIHETADLLYHLLVALVARDIKPARIYAELARRFGTSGHDEKASR